MPKELTESLWILKILGSKLSKSKLSPFFATSGEFKEICGVLKTDSSFSAWFKNMVNQGYFLFESFDDDDNKKKYYKIDIDKLLKYFEAFELSKSISDFSKRFKA